MNLIEKYCNALDDIYNHVGFKADWVVYPIDDCTEYYWKIIGDNPFEQEVAYHEEHLQVVVLDGNHYQDEIYTQRFYEKWIYEGKEYTMIFCDSHTDGMKYFKVFANINRLEHDN